MSKQAKKEPLGTARQVRFPKPVEADIQQIADANGIEWTQAVRQAAKVGVQILKKRMAETIKEAA